jgi:hypothetical protein
VADLIVHVLQLGGVLVFGVLTVAAVVIDVYS